jgi:RHS repeat-associated protein
VKGVAIQQNDYYPFGLAFNSYKRDNSVPQNYKYNSKEEQTELSLGWLDYGWRMYQPEIARWNAIDQYASVYEDFSPYSFGANNPIVATDYEGKLIVYVNGFRPGAYATYLFERTSSRNPLSVSAPHDHKENWFYTDTFDYWGEFNKSWSFPDEQRFYVDGSNHPSSTADDRFSKGQTEGKILADKIKSGEIKLEDAETIKLIGHSMGAAHAMGMARGLIDSGIHPELIQVFLFAAHQPNQIESVSGIFLLQAFRDGDKVSGKGDLAINTNSKNQRIGNNSEYARMPDGDDDGRGNHGIHTYTSEEFKQAQPKLYQYLIDKKIINPDGTLPE